jgi:hypothetical protein
MQDWRLTRGATVAAPLDRPSKLILFAWITSDVMWAIAFIRARKRHERQASVRRRLRG